MTDPHDPTAGITPRDLLPLRPARDGTSLAELVATIAVDVAAARQRSGLPPVTIDVDVAAGHTLPGDAATLRAGLLPLVAAACEAAAGATLASDSPRLREVVVTTVATPAGLEVEVADSGPGPVGIPAAALAAARGLADRFGGDVRVVACPEGGAAVTLRLPTRRHRSLAA